MLLVGLIALGGCEQKQALPLYAYLLIPGSRGGGERPSAPTDIRSSFVPGANVLILEWNKGTDPELHTDNLVYNVYLYLDRIPENFYGKENLFHQVVGDVMEISIEPFSETIWFVVTSWDGFVESRPSEILEVNITNRESWIVP